MELNPLLEKISKRNPTILGKNHFRTYSILVPLININGSIHVLFEVRSMNLRNQPGEICFPGGKVDHSDDSPKDAAIRETMEELGINRVDITQVYPIDYFIQSIEGRIIYPFVGYLQSFEALQPNPSEVKEIFTVPLDYLLQSQPEEHILSFQIKHNNTFPYHLIPGGKRYPWRTRELKEYFYFYDDYVIWGLTAAILRNFLTIIQEEKNEN